MRDVAAADRVEVDVFSTADRMSREVAILGGRLAGLIESSPVSRDGALAQGLAFLSAMSAATGAGSSIPDAGDPLSRMASGMGWTAVERDVVLLAAMPEEHEGYASVLRNLNPRGEPYLTAGLAAQLTCESGRDRFAFRQMLEAGAAVRAGVLRLGADAPFFERNVTLAEELWPVLCGIDVYPASLRTLALRGTTSGLESWFELPEVGVAMRAIDANEQRVVVLSGDSDALAADRAAALVTMCGRPWAGFELPHNAPIGTERLALVHAAARGAVPIFTLGSADGPSSSAPALEAFSGPVIVCARRGAIATQRRLPLIVLDAEPLPPAERERMWLAALPEAAAHAGLLAARYALDPAAAAEVAQDVRARAAADGGTVTLDMVVDSVRSRSRVPAGTGVRLVRPVAKWEQLVLSPDRKALLVEALDRLKHQRTVLDDWKFLDGRPGAHGVRVLLSGPPGTGKTLSAEVMAHSLGVDLMVVDISRVVSKWIGETEKHLAQAFDAAERSQVVLLFDEADALFGKRTEVSDAHDRYANLETAYLLSRLERFDGLAILSTNLKQNIDPAFLRRVEFVIDFDEPSTVEREALWRCHLPAEAPLAADVDLRELAALYPIVGGLIRNASVAAAFLAAAADTAIGRHHLVGAIRREYDKSAKAFPGAPLGVSPA
jgi:hypothetical protein